MAWSNLVAHIFLCVLEAKQILLIDRSLSILHMLICLSFVLRVI